MDDICCRTSLTTLNLFIYQARGDQPGPSRVSDSPVSSENVIYKAIVLMGEKWMVLLSTAFLEERWSIVKLKE